MHTTVLDTAVIGAGAAGLLVGRRLAERGERFELFDEHARIGDSWRERYRSLRLFTPRPLLQFPGLPIDIGRFQFPTGAELADYLERYARHFELPVRTSARVVRLSRRDGDGDDRGFRL
jgi:putative flavoprotein involved in K+ transport